MAAAHCGAHRWPGGLFDAHALVRAPVSRKHLASPGPPAASAARVTAPGSACDSESSCRVAGCRACTFIAGAALWCGCRGTHCGFCFACISVIGEVSATLSCFSRARALVPRRSAASASGVQLPLPLAARDPSAGSQCKSPDRCWPWMWRWGACECWWHSWGPTRCFKPTRCTAGSSTASLWTPRGGELSLRRSSVLVRQVRVVVGQLTMYCRGRMQASHGAGGRPN